ncbi:CocE/NonD family hydrolase [Haladaptatus sp. DYF46]|uniref:CocE/NonD family hydrolase n=1 Tax=Haladaptatus sp. DYF46 TaxID=2886041 RepID=UPI001E5A65F6|nr:CocE/NonD family hydrolase [Haladaptatus sp. DYF46]
MADVIVDRDVPAKMRDGTVLRADVYRAAKGRQPAILVRTPYGKDDLSVLADLCNPFEAVERGFAVVYQDCRGRYASDGDWTPYVDEAADGYDTVEWIADRPWCTGCVGIGGPSYLGITTWQAVIADPPHLEAALPLFTAGNLHEGWAYTGGAFELGFSLTWAVHALAGGALAARETVSEASVELHDRYVETYETVAERLAELPLTDAIAPISDLVPAYERWLEHPAYDAYWDRVDVTENIESASVPVLEVAGWYDAFAKGAFDIADAVAAAAPSMCDDDYHLVVGPWDHRTARSATPTYAGEKDQGYSSALAPVLDELVLPWFAHHLTDRSTAVADLPRIRYFRMGDATWQTFDGWPPAIRRSTYYLDSGGEAATNADDGRLVEPQPTDGSVVDSYRYDPLDPVPSVGGNTHMHPFGKPGVSDQSEVEGRDDVLVYTTPPLASPVSVVGRPALTLFVTSSAPDTDFTGKLVDVEPDGYCANITEGICRARYRNSSTDPEFMTPNQTYEVPVELWPTAHKFAADHRIRLEVSSSNFPRFDRNPNVAGPVHEADEADVQIATNSVRHGPNHPSKLSLPVRKR